MRFNGRDKFTGKLWTELNAVFGTMPKDTYNDQRFHPANMLSARKAPTAQAFLSSTLFDCFKTAEKAITIPLLNPDTVEIAFEVRHAPIIAPLPNFYAYTLLCNAPSTLEDDPLTTPYSRLVGDRILSVLKTVYYTPPFKFDRDDYKAFFDRVRMIAADFLTCYPLPYKWWHAVYTCAFHDAAYEMALYKESQVCWYFALWCEFWTANGNVTYTQEQLLHFYMQWTWIQ